MVYKLEPLPYPYDALEPFIDAKTMEIHHSKHHQAYVDKLNSFVEGHKDIEKMSPESLVKDLSKVSENIRLPVRNNGGGVVNHNFFWKILKKGKKPEGIVLKAIERSFGSFEKWKEEFKNSALNRFGSGWAWLVIEGDRLAVMSTANQDSPISEGKVPLLTVDVWEHAYYLKYQNRRAEYLDNFFNVIDWAKVNENYRLGTKR